MARAAITVNDLPNLKTIPFSAGALDIPWVASDAADGNAVPLTGSVLLAAKNTDSNPHTVSVSSAPDNMGRKSDITNYSVGAGLESLLGVFSPYGWQQSDLNLYVNTSDNSVHLVAYRIP